MPDIVVRSPLTGAPGDGTVPQPPATLQIDRFEFTAGASGSYLDGFVVDKDAMILFPGNAGDWLQDDRNFSPPGGFTPEAVRAILVAHTPDAQAAGAVFAEALAGHAEAAFAPEAAFAAGPEAGQEAYLAWIHSGLSLVPPAPLGQDPAVA